MYSQSSLATFLHLDLPFLQHRNEDIQQWWCHHPWQNVLLVGRQQRLVGRRKGWLHHQNRIHVLLPQLGSVTGSLGPLIGILQAILPIAPVTVFPTSRNGISKKLSRSFFLSLDLQRLSPMLSTWVWSTEHSSTMVDWLTWRRSISLRVAFRSALCLSRLPRWSDAWETCCRRLVGGGMGVLEDELIIQ